MESPKVFISRNISATDWLGQALQEVGIDFHATTLIDFQAVSFSTLPIVDWVFFYSKNGVRYFFQTIQENETLQQLTQSFQYATIGEGTAEYLQSLGYVPNFIGSGNPLQTASLFLEVAEGKRVLFPAAKHSKQSVQRILGKQIDAYSLVVYDNFPRASITIPDCSILIFTSPLNVQTYFQHYQTATNKLVGAIGKTTAAALLCGRHKEVYVADNPSKLGLFRLIRHLVIKE